MFGLATSYGMPEQPIQLPEYENMIKAGMHFGRKKSIFHPRMKPFVYILKENLYIIDLIKTRDALIKAIEFLKQAKTEGKTIIFVGTNQQSAEAIKSTAQALGMPYVINRWLGGTLTNFKTIMQRVKYLDDLESQRDSGAFEKYTKKEKLLKEREIESLIGRFEGIRKLTKIPDVVFVASLKDGALPVREARRMGIKIVSIVNTDSNPDDVDYAIPANDNSKKAVELILETIKDALA